MSTEHLVLFSVLLQLLASNLDLKFHELKVSMRKTFRNLLSNVRSGHKYGLVYPGVGWIIWRDEKELPAHLKFELHYLGGSNFIRRLN